MPGIKLQLKGFDDLLEKIQNANGNIDKAVETCAKQAAAEVQSQLVSEMQASAVPKHLISSMPAPTIRKDGNATVVEVGYKKGSYDPKNLSDAYKVLFLNYGTPHRKKHGKVRARGFIGRARTTASANVKKITRKTLKDILKELEK